MQISRHFLPDLMPVGPGSTCQRSCSTLLAWSTFVERRRGVAVSLGRFGSLEVPSRWIHSDSLGT